ncbi:hypothetical protein J4G07_06020 [Candidatus Poribacteria bacterium]|nr:hypothetical protein [Candidatus Poribacteria bacterium]
MEEASKREGLPVRDVDRFIWDLRAGGQRDTETDLTDCSEFWTPICKGELGELFAGKPESINKKGWMNEGWLGKTVHCDIEMWMRVTNRACYIQLYFYGENPSKSGNEVMALFSQSGYDCKNTDTSTDTRVKFSVLNKGKNDRDDWPEMRKKLVAMGTDIYNKIKESDL